MKAPSRAVDIMKVMGDTKKTPKQKALYVMRLVEGITDHYPPDNITKTYYEDVKQHVNKLDDEHNELEYLIKSCFSHANDDGTAESFIEEYFDK